MTSPNSDPNHINLDDFHFNNLDEMAVNTPSVNLDKLNVDSDPFSEFSFDDLMAMDDPVPASNVPNTQSVTTPVVPDTPNTSATPVTSATTPPTNTDLDFNFDSEPASPPSAAGVFDTPITANEAVTPLHTLNTPENITPTSDTSHTLAAASAVGAGIAGASVLANQHSPDTQPAPKKLFGLSLGKNKGVNDPKPSTATPKAKTPPKSLFGKKSVTPTPLSTPAGSPPSNIPTNTKLVKAKKNNLLPFILLGAVAALAAGWWFLTQSEPEPTPAPAPVAKKTTPTPVASATPATAVAGASTTVATASASVAAGTITNSSVSTTTTTTTAGSTTAPTLNKATVIKPEDITAPALPADNATAKEEIDRLAQQSKQLEEQEKMMEDQLKMMNELSGKKEERIAILEKQIAQIEAQKGVAKK